MRKQNPRSQKGVTLLEVMLVLGVSGTMLVMGIKLYQSISNTTELMGVQNSVDQLFDAASAYYTANCAAGTISPNPPNFLSPYPLTSGTVTYAPSITDYYPLSITNVLLTDGYLTGWNPGNTYVDPSQGESGYIVQLNPVVSSTTINVNACSVNSTGQACLPITQSNISTASTPYTSSSGSIISSTQAQVVTWVVQVAVKLRPNSTAAANALMLGADCTSGSSAPGTVDPCSVGNTDAQFAVWSRLPSQQGIRKNAFFAASLQLLKQYNLMYTHDANYEFNGGLSTSTSPTQAPVYYLCGG